MEIKTNNVPRPILDWHDLTPKEQAEFDYLETPEEQEGGAFFRYRDQAHSLSDFVRIIHKGSENAPSFAHHDFTGELAIWDGIKTDSFFSALVVRYCQHNEFVIVGLLLA